MPQFTDEKRRRIRESLLDAGYDRFVAQGLQETTIADLTDDAGIAAGTFYSFFDSKEELLAAVLRREAEEVHAALEDVLATHEDDPETAVRRFLEVATDAVIEDPLFSGTVSREDRERLRDALPETELASTRADKLSLLMPYVEVWQERGLIVDGDPETIALTVLYASYLPLRRDEVGRDRYPGVRDLLFRWVADGVTQA